MASNQFQFTLVTPEESVLKTEAEIVMVPAEKGEMGILVHHAPTMATLRPGLVTIRQSRDEAGQIYFVNRGFLHVGEESVCVLAEQARPLEALNLTDIELRAKQVEEEIAIARSEAEKQDLQETQGTLLKQVEILKTLAGHR